MDGGDLRSFLAANRQTYSEALAAQHLKQILLGAFGIYYYHSMYVLDVYIWLSRYMCILLYSFVFLSKHIIILDSHVYTPTHTYYTTHL